MTNHLEVEFSDNGINRNATVQLDKNGAYITFGGEGTVYIGRRCVEQFVNQWNEVQQKQL
jgi:hypothetical protein